MSNHVKWYLTQDVLRHKGKEGIDSVHPSTAAPWCQCQDHLQDIEKTLSRLEDRIIRLDERLWIAASSCGAAGFGALGFLVWKALGLS